MIDYPAQEPESDKKAASDFYQHLRERLRQWVKEKGKNHKYADYLLFAPDFLHLLCKLSIEPEVPTSSKAKLAAAIAYFVSPADLMPEGLLGPIGYLDDIAIAAYVLNQIVNETGEEVVRKHWAGDGDILSIIKTIISVASDMLGSGLWEKIKNMFGKNEI
jgi:uncharacterized membrane protein YkvA (DUF1232 family)